MTPSRSFPRGPPIPSASDSAILESNRAERLMKITVPSRLSRSSQAAAREAISRAPTERPAGKRF